MNDSEMRTLLVEDNPGDVRLVRELLRDPHGVAIVLTTVGSLAAAREALRAGTVDVILLDLGLPDSLGLETLTRVHAEAPSVPIVVMTGLDDHEMGIRAVREGAQDYLVKGSVDEGALLRAIRYAVERKRAEQQLLSEKAFTDAILDSMPGALTVFDAQGRAVRWNHQLEALVGRSADELAAGGILRLYSAGDRPLVEAAIRMALADGTAEIEADVLRPDGTVVPLLLTSARVDCQGHQYVTMVGIDITPRKQIEAAQRQSDERFNSWWKAYRERSGELARS